MLRRSSALVVVLALLVACGRPAYRIPKKDIKGSLKASVNGGKYFNGIFSVKGKEKEFIIFLYLEGASPVGSIKVEEDKIVKNSTGFEKDFIEIFKYWPFIFGWGKGREGKEQDIGSQKILYDDFKEGLPGKVKVVTKNMKIDIMIDYGNKDTGKN